MERVKDICALSRDDDAVDVGGPNSPSLAALLSPAPAPPE